MNNNAKLNIRFICHEEWITPGEYLSWAERNGHSVSYTRCWASDPVPTEPDADMLIVLGGPQNPATTKVECAHFDAKAEKALIRKYIDSGRIVIGSCLGAQLLGEAVGAKYERSPEPEIGYVEARLTADGRSDPFLSAFPDAFHAGEWHNDMPGLSGNAAVLAESDGCPRQIVRYSKFAYGFQTHMEFHRESILKGIEIAGDTLSIKGRFIRTKQELLDYDCSEMNRLLSSFLDAVAREYMNSNPEGRRTA